MGMVRDSGLLYSGTRISSMVYKSSLSSLELLGGTSRLLVIDTSYCIIRASFDRYHRPATGFSQLFFTA